MPEASFSIQSCFIWGLSLWFLACLSVILWLSRVFICLLVLSIYTPVFDCFSFNPYTCICDGVFPWLFINFAPPISQELAEEDMERETGNSRLNTFIIIFYIPRRAFLCLNDLTTEADT